MLSILLNGSEEVMNKEREAEQIIEVDINPDEDPKHADWLHSAGWAGQKGKISKSFENLDRENYYPDIYAWIDDTIEKAPPLVGGKPPKGAKTLGKQIEARLYFSLQDILEEFFDQLPPDTTLNQAIRVLNQKLDEWQGKVSESAKTNLNELANLGFKAGVIDTGVHVAMGLTDKMALEWLANQPTGFIPALKTFGEDIRKRFEDKISRAYAGDPNVPFNLKSMATEMQKETLGQRYKIERIIRTETAKVSNMGRLLAWEQDPDRNDYEYHWDAALDNRVKDISLQRWRNNPYTFDQIKQLWLNQDVDSYNQRCSISRAPFGSWEERHGS
jgi:hypothetical protein